MTRRVLGAVADSGPVVILAGIAAAGSFTHIRDTATEHGQHGWMAWAIAVCIDLTCVMAAGERQRDKRTGRDTGRLSWPTVVLIGGILLSLAANLAQADPSIWGWITAGTPAGAFLVAVSMLERRKAGTRTAARPSPVPDSFGRPEPSASSSGALSVPSPADPASSPWVVWEHPTAAAAAAHAPGDQGEDEQDGQTSIPVPTERPASTAPASSASSSAASSSSAPAGPLDDFARRVAAEHEAEHGRPITRDALRARLGVSNQLASDLLRQIRTEHTRSTAPVA
ncbi:DUF2637 domain-containing protein [Actinomadura madurae]|uniref:DUF2637 domain-containing protein n=1 Tax=Actinomadura madurae TaxID=1993 RepID=UPI0020D2228C|nr:DUF2637 domain-containing protein [Actinomadura madurae]MCP9952914.1 DUF2637 domain-containing protein [Actinomadura madurae]MCP9969677.1 DUF2637 domain-containing protein [Actinomadura madurae]MCP9982132.1 DUF2637 domain-containing protein [Actinomadura madurae]MCQ0006340.1 DUF2637 domain-containing protein [Actinomadura madurae]MCQ0018378.1 DUF2637 domain-containing protein [Actinomadura madurae]